MLPWSAALADHIKNNIPDPDREPPLRRYAESLAKGRTDLDDMAPDLITYQPKVSGLKSKNLLRGFGGLKSLEFKNVDPMGEWMFT